MSLTYLLQRGSDQAGQVNQFLFFHPPLGLNVLVGRGPPGPALHDVIIRNSAPGRRCHHGICWFRFHLQSCFDESSVLPCDLLAASSSCR